MYNIHKMFNIAAQSRIASRHKGISQEATRNPKVFWTKFPSVSAEIQRKCNVKLTLEHTVKMTLRKNTTHAYAHHWTGNRYVAICQVIIERQTCDASRPNKGHKNILKIIYLNT